MLRQKVTKLAAFLAIFLFVTPLLARETFYTVRSTKPYLRILQGVVTVGATGAVSADSSKGFAVTRSSAGTYRLTLTKVYEEIFSVDAQIMASTTLGNPTLYWDEWTNPAAADDDWFLTDSTCASATDAGTYTAASEFDGAGTDDFTLDPPRNVTLKLDSDSDWDATTAVVTGTDINGAAQTENISIPNNGNSTVQGVKAFSTVTQVVIPAQTGTGGTCELGFGPDIGFTHPIRTIGGIASCIHDHAAGTAHPTASTVVVAATATPNGTYDPNTDPDGANDYACLYSTATASSVGVIRETAQSLSGKTIDIVHYVDGVAVDPPNGSKLRIMVVVK